MTDKLPIIGIGASAGGLEALETFLENMPIDCNMAFVVIMHLDPSHSSLLPELLQRRTKMEVVKICDHQQVEKNKIYVIPPHKYLSIANGMLVLTEPADLHIKLPIDFFLQSLAIDQGNAAACVILSGTGSDGTLGLKAIKAELGYVIVQSIDSARYDGMPKCAINTGVADSILATQDIPQELIAHFNKVNRNPLQKLEESEELSTSFYKILLALRNKTGHDFALYKKKTIFRRIERRMQVLQLASITDYLRLIETDVLEVTTLFRDLLIGVTAFFRDKEAFHILSRAVIPALLKNKPENYTIRVWIPGCSTGEEAYSVAILLQEYLRSSSKNMQIQIFATDIDEFAIEKARSGIYPLSVKADIGEEYCQRYFIKEGDYYHVKKSTRELLVFALQNLAKDPPFSKLDMICCRNLLIYFSPELQKRVFPIFHYSLKQDAVLFLGPSETTGQTNDYFEIINRKWKLFKRKPDDKNTPSSIHFTDSLSTKKMEQNTSIATSSAITELSALQLVETILKKSHIPACVIVDSQLNIIYVHGRLGQYLEPAEGRLNNHILEMARTLELKDCLSKTIHNVLLHKKEITRKAIPVDMDDKQKAVDISVKLLPDVGHLKDLVMVNFTVPVLLSGEAIQELKQTQPQDKNDVYVLVKELESTRDNLETTIEELETSNEELKSSNEELQSTNEELQSTNEELETSKEELQSLNEESVTVNAQLQSHIDELSTANDDIKNLLDSTQVATLFLDTQLKIRRFTPKMTDIIHLMASDIQRPISHLSTSIQNVKLTDVANDVLKTLDKIEREVHDDKDQYYKMRVLPYRTANNIIAGVVITFEDISVKRASELALKDNEQRYKSLFDNCPVAIIEIDTSKLSNYIKKQQLTSVNKLTSHMASKTFVTKSVAGLVQALNVNNAGLLLFTENNKAALLDKIPAAIETESYLFNLMKIIIENKSDAVFQTSICAAANKPITCEITITVPTINIASNFGYSILVITPAAT